MWAALLVALGAAGSMLGAQAVARNDAQRSHQALVTSSMAIASTLKLAIQQENSLVVSAEAYIVENPNATNTEFLIGLARCGSAKRFPEVSGVGFIALVRPGQLSQFVARILADPPVPLAPGQPYQITPPGTRPFYCLVDDEYRSSGLVLPLSFDVCAGQAPRISKVTSRGAPTFRTNLERRAIWP